MVRVARAARAARTWRQRVGDVYELVLTFAILGGIGVEAGRRVLAVADSGAAPANARAVGWLLVALTVLLSGLALRGLAAIGPLVASPATRTWLLSTPVDRSDLLAARHRWALVAGLGVGTLYGVLLGVVGRSELALCLGLGALLGLALAGWAVRRQGGRAAWLRPLATAAIAAGLLLGLVVAGFGLSKSEPPGAPAWVLAVGVAVLAGLAGAGLTSGRRVRSRISRAALSDGAGLAGATVAAVQWFDPTLLSGLLTQRHWLRVASVRSTRLRARTRTGALLAADWRRLTRSRRGLLAGGALLVVCYALAAVISPVWTPLVQLLGATIAADRLAGGLRTVCRSPALRRALGGSDNRLRLAHLAVPAGGALVWSALSLPVVWTDGPLLGVLYPAITATAVVFRMASRPPVDYNLAGTLDPAVSVLPIGMLTQLFRGPSLLVGLAAIRLLIGVGS
jgi:hypothetical protein